MRRQMDTDRNLGPDPSTPSVAVDHESFPTAIISLSLQVMGVTKINTWDPSIPAKITRSYLKEPTLLAVYLYSLMLNKICSLCRGPGTRYVLQDFFHHDVSYRCCPGLHWPPQIVYMIIGYVVIEQLYVKSIIMHGWYTQHILAVQFLLAALASSTRIRLEMSLILTSVVHTR